MSAKEAGKQKQHLSDGKLGATAKAPGQGQQGAAPHTEAATATQTAEQLESNAAAKASSRMTSAQRDLELEGLLGGALREVLDQAIAEAAKMDAAQQKGGAAPGQSRAVHLRSGYAVGGCSLLLSAVSDDDSSDESLNRCPSVLIRCPAKLCFGTLFLGVCESCPKSHPSRPN